MQTCENLSKEAEVLKGIIKQLSGQLEKVEGQMGRKKANVWWEASATKNEARLKELDGDAARVVAMVDRNNQWWLYRRGGEMVEGSLCTGRRAAMQSASLAAIEYGLI